MKYAMINDENVLVYVLMLCHLITQQQTNSGGYVVVGYI